MVMQRIRDNVQDHINQWKRLIHPDRWDRNDWREIKALILLSLLCLLGGFVLGRFFECNAQGGQLLSYTNESFVSKYINPSCKFNLSKEGEDKVFKGDIFDLTYKSDQVD